MPKSGKLTFSQTYKRRAMRTCAELLAGAINHNWLSRATLVAIPPSKARGDPEYDDRMTQVCRSIQVGFPVDVRELVVQSASTEAAHESSNCPTVDDQLAIYSIDEALTALAPQRIAIIDDVLTTGTHYRAMHTRLSERFPGVQIVGMFIARRVFPDDQDGLLDFANI